MKTLNYASLEVGPLFHPIYIVFSAMPASNYFIEVLPPRDPMILANGELAALHHYSTRITMCKE